MQRFSFNYDIIRYKDPLIFRENELHCLDVCMNLQRILTMPHTKDFSAFLHFFNGILLMRTVISDACVKGARWVRHSQLRISRKVLIGMIICYILSALIVLLNITCLTFNYFSYIKAVLINTI